MASAQKSEPTLTGLKRGHKTDWEYAEEDRGGGGNKGGGHKKQHVAPHVAAKATMAATNAASRGRVGGSAGVGASSVKGLQAPAEGPGDREFTTDPAKLAMMSRSERKRHREKKRRSDVNKGFEDLIALLVEVDDGVRGEVEEERARRAQVRADQSSSKDKGDITRRSSSAPSEATSPTNAVDDNILSRVDLIDRATAVLRRIHAENEQRKAIIDHLLANGRAQGAQGGGITATAPRSSLPPRQDRPTLSHQRAAPSLGYGGFSASEDPLLASLLTAAAGGGPLGSAAVQREALIQQMELRQLLAGGGGVGGLHGGVGPPDWSLLQARARALSSLPLSQGEMIRLANSGGGLDLPPPPLPPSASRGSMSMEPHLLRALLLQQQQQREMGGGHNAGGRGGSIS